MSPAAWQPEILALAGGCTALDELALARASLLAARHGADCVSPSYLAVTVLLLECAVRRGRCSLPLERSSLEHELHALWQCELLQVRQVSGGVREFFAQAWDLFEEFRPQAVFPAAACQGLQGPFSPLCPDAVLVVADGRLYQRRHYDCQQELLRFAAAAAAAPAAEPQLPAAVCRRAAALRSALAGQAGAGGPDPGLDPGPAAASYLGLMPDLGEEPSVQPPCRLLDPHLAAAALALLRPLTIVSGGDPAASSRSALAVMLLQLAVHGPAHRLVLAAPTAGAVCRLQAELRAQLAALQPLPADQEPGSGGGAGAWPWLMEQAAAAVASAVTLQELLTPGPHAGGAADFMLIAGTLIITGASELDFALGCRLVLALRPEAHLILLGDRHQLGPQSPGALLPLWCGVMAHGGVPLRLHDALCALCGCLDTQLPAAAAAGLICGFGVDLSCGGPAEPASGPGALAAAVRSRQGAEVLGAFIRHGDQLSLRPWPAPPPQAVPGSPAEAAPAMAELLDEALSEEEGIAGCLIRLQRLPVPFTIACDQEAEAVWEQLARRCLLCAGIRGALGAAAVNAAIEAAITARYGLSVQGGCYPGRIVMISAADPGRGLCCGEVGFMARDGRDEGRLKLFLHAAGAAAHGPRLRRLGLSGLPHHVPAYALSVQQARIMEYQAVSIVLPLHHSSGLCAELLYTAVTRARERIILHGSPELIDQILGDGLRQPEPAAG